MTLIEKQIAFANELALLIRQGRLEESKVGVERLMQSLIPMISQLPTIHQQRLIQISEQFISTQQQRDWFGLADYLDSELIDFLSFLRGKASGADACTPV